MAKKIKALQTIAGSYGLAHAGDEVVVKDSVASELVKAGLADEVGEAEETDETKPVKGSVRFHDGTGKSAAAAGETDEANPTGPDKPVAKAAKPKTGKK